MVKHAPKNYEKVERIITVCRATIVIPKTVHVSEHCMCVAGEIKGGGGFRYDNNKNEEKNFFQTWTLYTPCVP